MHEQAVRFIADCLYCVLRINKSGTPLEYVTSVTDPHSAFGSQVDPMVVIGDEVYYMNIYTSGSYRVQKLAVAPAAGGDSSVLEEIIQAAGPHRLLYDQARDTFYWHGVGKKCIFKYNRSAKTLQSAPSNDGNKLATYPLAQDTEYLYWPTNNALYRMQKF